MKINFKLIKNNFLTILTTISNWLEKSFWKAQFTKTSQECIKFKFSGLYKPFEDIETNSKTNEINL